MSDIDLFGRPVRDVLREIQSAEVDTTGTRQVSVGIRGVNVFHAPAGDVRSDWPEGIACWFIDTEYNEESFFVRHAYFLGANDPYKSLKRTLKAEIDEDAWASLHSDTSLRSRSRSPAASPSRSSTTSATR